MFVASPAASSAASRPDPDLPHARMSTVLDCLRRLPRHPWFLVLHIGAGHIGLADAYTPLQPQRLHLVEGDLEAARELEAAMKGFPGAEVIAQAVSPEGGDLTWHRHTLRPLNGPLDARGLEAYYPRLRPLPAVELPSVPVATLVDRLLPRAQPATLLVLDVPGQEMALLEALGEERVRRFDHVVLHGRHLEGGAGHPFDAAWNWLQAAHFSMEPRATATRRPLWECTWGSLDRQALEVRSLAGELEALRRDAADREARHQAQSAQAEAQRTALEQDRTRLVAALEEAQAQARSAAQEAAGLTTRLQATEAELASTAAARDQQKHWHEENARWARGLTAELQEREARFAALEQAARAQAEQALSQQAALELERAQLSAALEAALAQAQTATEAAGELRSRLATTEAAAVQQAAGLLARLEAAEAEVRRLEAELTSTAAARDQQRLWHEENAKWARGLNAELQDREARLAMLGQAAQEQAEQAQADKAALEQERSHLSAALEAAQAQLRAAGRVTDELRARLGATEDEVHRLEAELATTAAARDEQKHWHEENAKWARGLAADLQDREARLTRLEQTAQAQATLEQELAQLSGSLEEARAQARAAAQEADDLRARLDARDVAAFQEATGLIARLETAEGQARQLAAELASTAAARDQQKLWHEENAKWARTLDTELKSARAELLAAQQQAESDRQQRQGLEQQVAQLGKERDTEAHWHRENAKWAQSLKAELESHESELDRLRRELDLTRREAADAKSRAEGLEREVGDRDARQRLMDAEILRAEAQLDLIKEVLIREKNF